MNCWTSLRCVLMLFSFVLPGGNDPESNGSEWESIRNGTRVPSFAPNVMVVLSFNWVDTCWITTVSS